MLHMRSSSGILTRANTQRRNKAGPKRDLGRWKKKPRKKKKEKRILDLTSANCVLASQKRVEYQLGGLPFHNTTRMESFVKMQKKRHWLSGTKVVKKKFCFVDYFFVIQYNNASWQYILYGWKAISFHQSTADAPSVQAGLVTCLSRWRPSSLILHKELLKLMGVMEHGVPYFRPFSMKQ